MNGRFQKAHDETALIGSLEHLDLVTNSQGSDAIKEYVGEKADIFDSFLVKQEEGDYVEIWGFFGIVAYNYKTAYRLL